MGTSDIAYQGRSPQPADDVVSARFERAASCLAHEPRRGALCWQAHAPGRLDVMGGIAEYTGALVLGITTRDGVTVTVQPRDDARIVVYGSGRFTRSETESLAADVTAFDAQSYPRGVAGLTEWLSRPEMPWLPPVGGALYAMLTAGKLGEARDGMTIVVDSELPPLIDVGYPWAVAIPLLMALSEAWGLHFDPVECAQLATVGTNATGGYPTGAGTPICVLRGRAGGPVEVNSRKHEVAAFDLPKGVTLVGIDCGFKHPDAVGKYVRARAAAFMGKAFIEAALAARRGDAAPWDGALSSISVKDYVGFLRDRIPTRIKGADFREKFKKSFDPLTEVDPELTYKVRSRTEHHIYEADRVFQFAGHLGRARRTGDRSELQGAGKEMLASHWSYGQRCGLGSIPTDTLVSLLREREEDGIYGAKVSAQGAGGVVVVLMEDTERAQSALRDALALYERGQARQTAMFEGGTDGALHYGVRQYESLDCPKP